MKKNTSLIVLTLCVLSFFAASPLFAVTRGIRVIGKGGTDLFLYNDYCALVVGISDYEKWPKLPYAVNDAKEVAQGTRGAGLSSGAGPEPHLE